MKRLLLVVALMVLVTLVGMVGVSSAGDPASAISNTVSALHATANPAAGAINASLDTQYDLDTVYDWETVYALEKVYARVPASAKMYYLTTTGFTGGDAITACDPGFHMAILSEIQDPSTLQYAPRRTPAYDSPYDSPAFDQASDQFPDHTGWVRTEADALTGLVYNCDVWRSSSDQQSGTMMMRGSLWGENGRSLYNSDPAAWWQATRTASCSLPEHVWCVEDPD